MVFSEIFIKKPIMTVLVMMTVIIFGLAAYMRLPISDLPSVDYPVMVVNVSYPGASPSTMASTVASPLENEFMEIQGLQTVISDNTEGTTQIILTFDLDRNVNLIAPDVQAAISRATANLPTDLPEPPTYQKVNPSEAPIIYIMLTSDTMTPGDLYDYGNRSIGQRLSIIAGVSQVYVWGAKRAIRIQVDPNKLASLKIGLDEVAQAIREGTVTIPGGSLNGASRTFSVEPAGQLLKAEDYRDLIVTYRNNAPVRLGEIAKCVNSLDNDVISVMYGKSGEEVRSGSVVLAILKQGGANTVGVSRRIKDTLNELRAQIPGSIDVDIFYDKSQQIIASVKDVKNTIFIALTLVVLVIFLFIGRLSDTIIPGTVLPVSIIGTFLIMLAAGFSLDNLSLMGITLSVGFLVDDAIVVLENTVRHIEEGKKPFQATIISMKEITGTVISTSISLITVFIPLVFMGGVVGRNFKEFALTVVAAIICSTIVALTLTPMMCARILRPKNTDKTKTELFTDKFVGVLVAKYKGILMWVLQHRHVALIVWGACLLGTFWMFSILPKTFMPVGDSGAVEGEMLAQQGTSTKQMQTFQNAVNNVLKNNPTVEKLISVTGLTPGADQTTGKLFAVLKPPNKRPGIEKVVNDLRAQMSVLPYGFVFLMPLPSLSLSAGGESTAAGSQYSYVLTASDREVLYEHALEFEKRMKGLPYFAGVQNSVKLNMPQLNIRIFRDRASALGITADDIETTLGLAFSGGKVTTYKTDVDQYNVIVELEKKYSQDPDNLSRIYVRSKTTGKLIPLGSLAEWTVGVGPQNVPHADQLNSATISFNLKTGVALGTATTALHQLAQEVLPATIGGKMQGQAQEFEEAVGGLTVLLFVAVFIMYVILGILYESYVHPFTVLTTLPVAAFGGLATLFICRSELSIYAYIGVFMLLGIVSKNGIMMVDFANQNLEEKGLTNIDAIYDACITRFRPILMTGASTIIGAAPIAFGFGADGASRRPLGLIVMGGLLFAQVITLLVTPGIFLYMQDIQEKFLNRFELTRAGAARKEE